MLDNHGNKNIFYVKQANGNYIVMKKVLTGGNKLRFELCKKVKIN